MLQTDLQNDLQCTKPVLKHERLKVKPLAKQRVNLEEKKKIL